MRYIRMVAVGACSGLIAGLVWGIGARLAMRIMAVAAGRHTGFSLEGTVFILLVGVTIGLPAGMIYLAIRTLVPGTGVTKMLGAGVVTLLVLGYPFYIGPLRDEASLGHHALAVALFGGLFVVAGMALEAAFVALNRRIPHGRGRMTTAITLILLAIPSAFALFIVYAI